MLTVTRLVKPCRTHPLRRRQAVHDGMCILLSLLQVSHSAQDMCLSHGDSEGLL